jgi:hypothetical protein
MIFQKRNWLSVGMIFLLSMTISCAKSRQQTQDDPVLEAYRLIDEQRTDEAIELLETSIANDPSNTTYKPVLASAYAHKAGIRIQTLIPFLVESEKLKKMDSKPSESSKLPTAGEQLNASVLSISQLLRSFSTASEVYASIPLISKKNLVHLNQAIFLLNDAGAKIKPEDALYRAVLEVVLFKYILAEDLVGEFAAPKEKNSQSCRIDIGNLNNSVIKLGRLLIDIYSDLGIANPKNAGDVKQMSAKTADAISNVTIATTTVTILDEASNLFLKQSIIQNGFGKIIKCGGS